MKALEMLFVTRPIKGGLPYIWGMDGTGKQAYFRTLKPTSKKTSLDLFEEILANEIVSAGLEWKNPPNDWREILQSDQRFTWLFMPGAESEK